MRRVPAEAAHREWVGRVGEEGKERVHGPLQLRPLVLHRRHMIVT